MQGDRPPEKVRKKFKKSALNETQQPRKTKPIRDDRKSAQIYRVQSSFPAATIDSQTLLKMVNEVRKLCSEKPVRNNDFIARVKDELEGETYEIFVGQKNGAEIDIITMTYKQALRVAARESKAVRRSLV